MKFRLFKKIESKQDVVELVFKLILIVLAIVYFIFLIFGGKWFGETSDFYIAYNLFSGAKDYNPWIRIVSYIFFIFSISFAARAILSCIAQFLKKGKAILNLLASLIKYAAVIVLIFMILGAFKVDTATLLISAGVVSLVIGLGAQSLISDVIAGLFIVFEEVFDIGDIIVVDGFRGTVKEIGIRTTQIVDWGGNIKVVTNSDIKNIVNMTSQLSVALVDVDIEYGESLERVEAVIKDNLEAIKEAIPDIIDGPYYKGVANLGSSGVTLRFIAQCKEDNRFQVERDLNRQLKLIFDENDVGIPFNQVTINQPKEFIKVTKTEKDKAKAFIKEQNEESAGIPSEPNNEY